MTQILILGQGLDVIALKLCPHHLQLNGAGLPPSSVERSATSCSTELRFQGKTCFISKAVNQQTGVIRLEIAQVVAIVAGENVVVENIQIKTPLHFQQVVQIIFPQGPTPL